MEKILDAIGVERVRFHDLRHSFATHNILKLRLLLCGQSRIIVAELHELEVQFHGKDC